MKLEWLAGQKSPTPPHISSKVHFLLPWVSSLLHSFLDCSLEVACHALYLGRKCCTSLPDLPQLWGLTGRNSLDVFTWNLDNINGLVRRGSILQTSACVHILDQRISLGEYLPCHCRSMISRQWGRGFSNQKIARYFLYTRVPHRSLTSREALHNWVHDARRTLFDKWNTWLKSLRYALDNAVARSSCTQRSEQWNCLMTESYDKKERRTWGTKTLPIYGLSNNGPARNGLPLPSRAKDICVDTRRKKKQDLEITVSERWCMKEVCCVLLFFYDILFKESHVMSAKIFAILHPTRTMRTFPDLFSNLHQSQPHRTSR